MPRSIINRISLIINCLCLFLAFQASAHAQATASFNPASVELGDATTYTVNFENVIGMPEGLRPPAVAGLTFSGSYGTSTQMTIVNGRMSQKVGASWQVKPSREGSFNIPAWTVVAQNGSTLNIPAATLTVSPVSQDRRDAIFWEISLSDGGQKSFLVGERVPVTVSLFVRMDHQVASRFNLKMSTEAVSFEPGELLQSMASKGGQSYQRRDWKGFLTPAKSGEHELNFSAEVVLITPGRGIAQQELISPPFKMVVSPLPLENRPDHFDGAVGQYRLSQQQGSTQLAVGDALTVTLELIGNGDLQGSAGPGFPAAEGLKVYPGRNPAPESDEQGRINATYNYTVIPSKAGTLTLPAARFAYYDSAARQYVNLSTKPVTLTVAPTAASQAASTSSSPATSPAATTPAAAKLPASYELNLPVLGGLTSLSTGFNLLSNKTFLALQAVPALLLIGLVLLGLRNRRAARDPYWALGRARRAALRQWSETAAKAAQSGDTESFRTAARRWLQYVAAPTGHSEPSALSALEIADFLGSRNSPSDLVQELAHKLSLLESPVSQLGNLPAELKATESLAHRVAAIKG